MNPVTSIASRRDTDLYRLFTDGQNAPVASEIRIARSMRSRIIGLLFTQRLTMDQGLVFPGVWSIHTVGMRYPIDIVWLQGDIEGEMEVVDTFENLKPTRHLFNRSADHVMELTAGWLRFHGVPKHLRLERLA